MNARFLNHQQYFFVGGGQKEGNYIYMYVIFSDFFGSDYKMSIKCYIVNYTVIFSGMVSYNMHVRIGTAS